MSDPEMERAHAQDSAMEDAMRWLRDNLDSFEIGAEQRGSFLTIQMQDALRALRNELQREHDHLVRRWD